MKFFQKIFFLGHLLSSPLVCNYFLVALYNTNSKVSIHVKLVLKTLYLPLCRNQKFSSCVCTRPPECGARRSRDRARPFQAYGIPPKLWMAPARPWQAAPGTPHTMTGKFFGAAQTTVKEPLSLTPFLGIILLYEPLEGGGPHVPDRIYSK